MREITRSLLKFLLGFIVVLIVSALLAPWLHTFLPFKFDRILRRLIMIGTLLLVWGLVRSHRESLKELGLGKPKEGFSFFGKGFLFGLGLVVLLSVVQWYLGARFWHLTDKGGWHWIGYFFKALGAGILICALEEFFFRGFMFFMLRDLWNTPVSLIVTNFIYALVHFFPKGRVFVGANPTVRDSLRILGGAVTPSASALLEMLLPMAGLFLFGLILSFLFLRTRTLYTSMGVHAGAIFALKLNRRFLPEISDKMNFLSGTKNLYDGMGGLVILLVAAILAGLDVRKHQKA